MGDWQTSRVYAALKQPSLSLQFAKSSLEIARKNNLPEVLATAYEAVARAYAAAGNYRQARSFLGRARRQLGSLKIDDEDRRIYLGQIGDAEKMIRR